MHPKPEARVAAFFSLGEALYGGTYYDTQTNRQSAEGGCLLASQMNAEPLTLVYGAPLRLRVENQLDFDLLPNI